MKNKVIKKLLITIVVIIMIVNMFTNYKVFATNEITYTLSNTITAKLSEDGTLTVSGTGNMPDFSSQKNEPWYGENIKKVIIENGITSVSKYGFCELKELTTISLSNTVTSIGEGAFYGCSSLKEFNAPTSLRTIESGAFAECTALTQIKLNEGLKKVSSYVFQSTAITEMSIPSTVTDWGFGATLYCSKLEEFKVADGNTEYFTDKGVLYWKPTQYTNFEVSAYPSANKMESYEILEGVKCIDQDAFYNAKNLKQVTIPNSITMLRAYAFAGSGLTTVTVPEIALTVFAPGIFKDCTNLETVNFYANPDAYFTGAELVSSTFLNCTSLKNVNIAGNIDNIAMSCFENCTSLEEITIPETVKTISSKAFLNCTSLKNVNWSENIEKVSESAFEGCTSLKQKYPDKFELRDNGYYMPETADIKITGEYKYDLAQQVLELVNLERTNSELSTLVMDEQLFETANQRAAELAIRFEHDRPDLTDCYEIFPSNYYTAAENIAIGQSTASSVMLSWMNSSGHRTNIMNPNFKAIGISCFYYNGTYYWVQCFTNTGTQMTNYPKNETVQATIPVALRDLEFSCSTQNITLGVEGEKTISITGTYQNSTKFNCDNEAFTWTVDDKSVATVKNGTIYGIGKGKTNVYAKVGSKIITFTVTVNDYELGDINADGSINARDAKLVLQYYSGQATLSAKQKLSADVNGDGIINARDAKLILQYYSGKIQEF